MRSTLTFFAQKLRKSEGFTLLELVVVIAVLSILSSISIPAFLGFIERDGCSEPHIYNSSQ